MPFHKNSNEAACISQKVQKISKKRLTKAHFFRIIAHVERLKRRETKQNIGDLHSGSAVDSDSTCGSSILSSPTSSAIR